MYPHIMSHYKRQYLTSVTALVTRLKSRSPRDAYRRQAVRWSGCGARGRICSPLPGGLGIMSPGIMTGVGGASLAWDRRSRVTPAQTESQEAWPEAEPLGRILPGARAAVERRQACALQKGARRIRKVRRL